VEFGVQFFPDVKPEEKSARDYFAESLEIAEEAERLGFTHARIVEHYFHYYGGYSPNPMLFLSAASQRTKRMRLVTGAVLPVFNNPLKLAGEIGTIERFDKEGSLALYLGMATLDNSSGKYQGTKAPKQVNTRAKAAMMIGVDRHRKKVAQSQRYYEKKRAEGKKHNQAIRALGRHLTRIIYKLLKEEREYEIRPEQGNTKTRV